MNRQVRQERQGERQSRLASLAFLAVDSTGLRERAAPLLCVSASLRLPLLCALCSVCALAGCVRPRYAHHSVDRYAFSRGTGHASGWLEPSPEPPVARLSQVAPGQRLVLSCTDFDRGVAFEAIVTPADGRYAVLVLSHGRPEGMSQDQRSFLAPLLDVDVSLLEPATDGPAYAARRESLEKAAAADPAAGLDALASHGSVLFPSDAADLLSRSVRHAKATPDVLAAATDLAARRRDAGPALRGWLRSGGASRLLEQILREPGCTRELALKAAADALSGAVRGDRELVLLAVLKRPDLAAADLASLLESILGATAPSSERRRVAIGIARHPSADASVLGAAVAGVERIEFSSDRRQVLAAVLAAPGSAAALLDVVKAAATQLDYDDDRAEVLVAAAKHAGATDAVREAIRASLASFRFERPRALVEAALGR